MKIKTILFTAFLISSCTKKSYRAPKVGETFYTKPINLVDTPTNEVPVKAAENCSDAHQMVSIMWGGRELYSKEKDYSKDIQLHFYDGTSDEPFYTADWEQLISDDVKGSECGEFKSYLLPDEDAPKGAISSYLHKGRSLICKTEFYLPFHKATRIVGTPKNGGSSRKALNWFAYRKVPQSAGNPGLCMFNIALYK